MYCLHYIFSVPQSPPGLGAYSGDLRVQIVRRSFCSKWNIGAPETPSHNILWTRKLSEVLDYALLQTLDSKH